MTKGKHPHILAFLIAGTALATCCLAQTAAPKPHAITPPSAEELDTALRRGGEFLLATQNPDGSWGSARKTKALNIYAPVPGAHHSLRVGVTSLAVAALIEAGGPDEDVRRAIERGEAYLLKELPNVRRAVPRCLYNNWAHGYGIRALVRMYHRLPKDAKRRADIRRQIAQQVGFLKRFESLNGGWGYLDARGTQRTCALNTCFMTASCLIALHEAAELGVPVPKELREKAVRSVLLQQNPDFTYLYSESFRFYAGRSICQAGGSLARSQVCNLALRLWGDRRITDDVLKEWLDRLFARNGWLSRARKMPVPHESWYNVSGYFYFYGHFYAAACIEQLPPAQRPYFQDHLARIIMDLQEKDGSWWDYPMYDYHQGWGTAYAMMTLVRCRKEQVGAAVEGTGGQRRSAKRQAASGR